MFHCLLCPSNWNRSRLLERIFVVVKKEKIIYLMDVNLESNKNK
jgi:hypothetical protein